MSDGVASALGGERATVFWTNLAKLKTVCGIKTCGQWCKMMSGSVASVLGDNQKADLFWTNLATLKTVCGIETCDQWCKIICNSVASVLSGDKADVFIRGVERLRDVAISLGEAHYDLSSFIGDTMASAIKNGKIDDIVAFVQLVGSIRKSQSYLVKESLLGILPDFFKLQDDQASELLASDRNKRRAIVKDIKAQKRQRI